MSEQERIGRARPEAGRWTAVLTRDARADGHFVFAVRSTGIYCRPSCPSRRPRRERVVFFAGPEAAERAGFRACRRCQPDRVSRGDRHRELVERACRAIEAGIEEAMTLSRLAEVTRASPHHLLRVFKRLMGVTPKQYADAHRLRGLKVRLRRGQDVTSALYDAGYGSSSRLYERAPSRLGMTPATYRRGGKNMRIDYTIVGSSLGRLLVARTPRGLCAVSLADSDTELKKRLGEEFPAAAIRADRNGLGEAVRALLHYLDGRETQLDLPLDVRGTAFQCRVWEALRRIPYGETRSYGEIARALRQPGAARAVGHACAVNPVPLVIPCHRVVRGDGALGGYGLGLERKKKLLQKEKALTTESQSTQRKR